MNLKDLMSGIAVVIDDKIGNADAVANGDGEGDDLIIEIVNRLEREWSLPFYRADRMPSKDMWPSLLQSASFILLDWKLWPSGASHQEQAGIKENVRFLEQARNYFVPVFIFTNESLADVKNELPETIYRDVSPEKNFVFIQAKGELLSDDSLDLGAVERWMTGNVSVYALKTWEQVFRGARKDLFASMYARNPDWPRVFWNAYEEDGVDPSFSLTHLINDSLRGRMRTTAFEAGIFADSRSETSLVPMDDLRALIHETTFQSTNSEDQIRCGDLFKQSKGKFLLNIRPDCDCIPRDGSGPDDVDLYCIEGNCISRDISRPDTIDLYCIEGKRMSESDLNNRYQNGHFNERVNESVVFAAFGNQSIIFRFNKLRVEKFGCLKDQRIGRLLHPYMTRIQQRYALFLQRQGLPRIPEAAIREG